MKFFLPNDCYSTRSMLSFRGYEVTTRATDSYDAMIFTGGSDICPFLYGQKSHPYTSYNLARDLREVSAIKSKSVKFPKIGLCRGAQLLNVMSGGSMVQHITGHPNTHDIRDERTGNLIRVNSIHHQMMDLSDNCILLATTNRCKTRQWESADFVVEYDQGDEGYINDWEDPEAFFCPDTNSLGVQYHPEYLNEGSAGRKIFWDWFDEFLLDEVKYNRDKRVAIEAKTNKKGAA